MPINWLKSNLNKRDRHGDLLFAGITEHIREPFFDLTLPAHCARNRFLPTVDPDEIRRLRLVQNGAGQHYGRPDVLDNRVTKWPNL